MSRPSFVREDGREYVVDETKPHVSAVCPFCGGTYTTGTSTDGEIFIFHTIPPCERFLELEILDYLQAARLAGARVLS